MIKGTPMTSRQKTKPHPALAAVLRPASCDLPVGELRHALGLNRRLFSRLTGYSERAIADWEAGKEVSDSTRQRLTEIQRLQQALAHVIKADFVGTWLQTPNPAFDGLKPIEIVERGEIDRLWRMVFMLEAGQPG